MCLSELLHSLFTAIALAPGALCRRNAELEMCRMVFLQQLLEKTDRSLFKIIDSSVFQNQN